ncbi:SDR family NAD(P)-dependent oxidoreductase [Zhongshania arctica]|uniref:SDR family NAD(P)-dependent oxidoreductase n=1 Tax=Zhongshania arctica TaxID=3238302 RepID=A0ABV3TV79_9GAMM
MNKFTSKVAVITGAGSGIGRALAKQLAAENARLALSDINAVELEKTCHSLPDGCEFRSYVLDVSSREAVYAHAVEVEQDFGAAHYVFNNAGVDMIGTIENMEIDEIEWQLNVNLWGVIYGCKAFLPIMRRQGEGSLVNISSVFGLVSYPAQGAYNISKFGVRALTECLWRELEGSGINTVCVHPGGIKTNIEKGGRRTRNAGPQEAEFTKAADALLVTPPEKCAEDILNGIRRGKRRILTGHMSSTLFWLSRLLPNHYHRVISWLSP